MIIKNDKPHLGDALMILAMMQDDDVYVGTPICNALLMSNVKTIPIEHCVHWDVDVSDIGYSDWAGYAKALNVTWNSKPAKLIVSKDELAKCKLPNSGGKKRVGICCWSRDKHRSYPHFKELVKQLAKYYETHIFGLQQLPIRQLVAEVSQMDLFVSCDTGLAHIAGSFDIPLIIIEGPTDCHELYSCYKSIRYVSTKDDKCTIKPCVNVFCKYVNCLYLIHPKSIVENIGWFTDEISLKADRSAKSLMEGIAILRLDGLGGTVTLSDQAKKIHEQTGQKVTLITRGYEMLFENNPHIVEIINVGMRNWKECSLVMKGNYENLAEVRFGIGKWFSANSNLAIKPPANGLQLTEQWFKQFPKDYNQLSQHNLHHIQLTDMTLGLPYNLIESEIFLNDERFDIGEGDEFILVNNGVDIIHRGMRQTKCWERWDELVPLLPLKVVQIGTLNDPPIERAVDLRGQTNLRQLVYLIKKAARIIVTEGGIMHLAYAAKNPNVIVLGGPTQGSLFAYPEHKWVTSYVCGDCWSTTDDWYAQCPKDVDAVCMKTILPQRVSVIVNETLVSH